MLTAVLLIACGSSAAGDASARTAPPTAAASPDVPYQVTCADDQRPSSAVYDYVPEAVGTADAATAVQAVLPGELGVRADQVQRLGGASGDYRAPGDTYTVMGVRNEAGGLLAVAYVRPAAGGGWLVDTVESCGGATSTAEARMRCRRPRPPTALRLGSAGGRAGLVSSG